MNLKSFSFSFIIIIIIIIIYFLQTSFGKQINPHSCPPSSCGNIRNISYPFRLSEDPKECGEPECELACENNITSIYIVSDQKKYFVQAINYDKYTIRLTDPSVKVNDSCSFPQYSFSPDYFPTVNPYVRVYQLSSAITLMSCPYPVNYNSSLLLDISGHCSNESIRKQQYTYIKYGSLNGSYVMENCSIDLSVITSLPLNDGNRVSLSEIHSSLLYGFELSWINAACGSGCRSCRPNIEGRATCNDQSNLYCKLTFDRWWDWQIDCYGNAPVWFDNELDCKNSFTLFCWVKRGLRIITVFVWLQLGGRILIGMPLMMGFLIYKFRRRHLSMFDDIEGFLQSNNNFMPIRYSYSNIKQMTRGFREKLGEGGYGSVYKGKLRSGHDVAVKVLSKPSANGQDFINEVATIGRIHHVNVVKLIGYCAERSHCALIYEFMPNGSLEKYLSSRDRKFASLTWERKYEIAIGAGRGIEYLHQGCDIQILHFDIKPHNILLDDNFTPKISDFGLAKFYSIESNDIVTLTAARGTIGYVAPELINRSIGAVSYKADVYSFGMLLMEMVGVKRDMIKDDDKSSQYFPNWIYDRLNQGRDIEIGYADENDYDNFDDHARNITRKLTIVGLWCIQMSPEDRPSMSEVVKMLEGKNENLRIPPQPSPLSQINITDSNLTWGTESMDSTALLAGNIASSSE